MMKDVNVKSVRYPLAVDQKFEKVALKLGRTKRQIFIQMVDYFYKSKKDPADLNDEVLKKELSSGIHRIISFIRQQENDLLAPIYSEVQELNTTTLQHTRLLEKYSQQNIADGQRLDAFLPRLRGIEDVLTAMQNRLLEKEILKQKFRKILDFYINHREALGWPVSGAKKTELAEQARRSLQNL
ncbi:MAG TPA: BfmA/BtgA family mobilization protein [Anseongella sp.]